MDIMFGAAVAVLVVAGTAAYFELRSMTEIDWLDFALAKLVEDGRLTSAQATAILQREIQATRE